MTPLDLGGCMARVTLPYPPSANAYWRSVKGRVLVSKEGRKYKALVAKLAGQYLPLVGPVKVRLHVHRPRAVGDLDNTLKVLFDALKLILWLDDDQVVTIHATRLEERAGGEVVVEAEGEGFATRAMVEAKRAALALTAAKAKKTRAENRRRGETGLDTERLSREIPASPTFALHHSGQLHSGLTPEQVRDRLPTTGEAPHLSPHYVPPRGRR